MGMANAIDEFAESIDIPILKALVQSASGMVALGGKATEAAVEKGAATIDSATAKASAMTEHFSPNTTPSVTQSAQIDAPQKGMSLSKGEEISAPGSAMSADGGLGSQAIAAPSQEQQFASILEGAGFQGMNLNAMEAGGLNNLGDMSQTVAMDPLKQQQQLGIG